MLLGVFGRLDDGDCDDAGCWVDSGHMTEQEVLELAPSSSEAS
jgi:hypothetical protein